MDVGNVIISCLHESLSAVSSMVLSQLNLFCVFQFHISHLLLRRKRFLTEFVLFCLSASNISNPHRKYLLWESKQGHVHCNGGFFYSDGDLVVPTQGYYRVYVQLTFEGEAESCKSEEMLLLTYSVFYYHDSYPSEQLLLTAVDTTTCPKKWKKSLYSSSVFFLEAKSRLCVASSLSNHVLKNENETFFGADRLPD